MREIRVAGFAVSLFIVGFAMLPIGVLAREEDRWRVGARLLHLWARIVLRSFGIRVAEPRAPGFGTPRVLVSNHVSYLDIPVHLARGPCLFLAKSEVARWPIIGRIARRAGVVFVDRDDLWSRARAILEISRRLQAGLSVVVFPEGTTSLTGPVRGEASLFAGAFRAARMECRPVEALFLEYDDPARCAWLGDDDFASHLWNFLKGKRTLVRVRSARLEAVEDRAAQRASVHGFRDWVLEKGRSRGPVSRVLSSSYRTSSIDRGRPNDGTTERTICLGRRLPGGSSDLPEAPNGTDRPSPPI